MALYDSLPAVLMIECDPSTRELYGRELGREYHVLACADEHEALAILGGQPIGVVVLEPAGLASGWTLLAQIKHDPHTQWIPVILCTTSDERKRGLELGATAYLIKPVLPATLSQAVRSAIQGRVACGALR